MQKKKCRENLKKKVIFQKKKRKEESLKKKYKEMHCKLLLL